jgi:hypothetical protein
VTRADQIRSIIKQAMPFEMYTKSGGVMLSGTDALRPGLAYIMGLNPGGDPAAEGHERSIIDSVHDRQRFSCYRNECWQPRCEAPEGLCEHMLDGTVKPEFLVRHQRNAALIADALRLDITSVFSANAIFARSTSRATLQAQTGYSMEEWWQACWPVHQHFLAEVRPRAIISLGYGTTSSAFGLLWRKAEQPTYRRLGDDNRCGGWAFDAPFELADGASIRPIVVGVPHPSYMAIGPELAKALTMISN